MGGGGRNGERGEREEVEKAMVERRPKIGRTVEPAVIGGREPERGRANIQLYEDVNIE